MLRTRVSSLVRRVVLMHVAVAPAAFLACGARVESSASPSEAGAGDSAAKNDAADDGPRPCTVLSSVPVAQVGGSCLALQYPLSGTYAECDLSEPECSARCPAPPGVDAGVSQCTVYECPSGPIQNCSTPVALVCSYDLCTKGRLTAGIQALPRARAEEEPVARFLARMVYLEAASVVAFERLARELDAHGAPARLSREARRAARDEERHTRIAMALAGRDAASVTLPRTARGGRVRSLEAIAIENAVEGCVRETFGAAVAMVQARKAGDPRVRAAMRRVAPDEMSHADLAWNVARWLEQRLDPASLARVSRARRRAARELLRKAGRQAHPDLVEALGVPTAAQARAIAGELVAELWAPTLTRSCYGVPRPPARRSASRQARCSTST